VDTPHSAEERLSPARQPVNAEPLIGQAAAFNAPPQLMVVAVQIEPLLTIEQTALEPSDPCDRDIDEHALLPGSYYDGGSARAFVTPRTTSRQEGLRAFDVWSTHLSLSEG
jgi:hypothetical protein